MTKEEFVQHKKGAEDLIASLKGKDTLTDGVKATVSLLLITIADIARQLTIIADAQKRLAYPIIYVDKNGVITPPPADDALVEAVKRFIDENLLTDAAITTRKGAGKETIDVSIDEVKKLKAAHKQAVR